MQEKISTRTINGKEYSLFYDAATGDHSLQKVGAQFITVFEDGNFTEEGKNDTNLSDSVVNDIKSDIATAFKNSGGTSNGSVNPYPDTEVTTTGTSVLD